MKKRITTDEYLRTPETNQRIELIHGFVVREPPASFYGHQQVVGQLFSLLKTHVDACAAGSVCLSPVDVVLDADAALILQPDIIFVSNERASIIHDQVMGAPDLVVEVVSAGTEYRDRTIKLEWYRRYGVRECWIVDPRARTIHVVDGATGTSQVFRETAAIRSHVLPGFAARVEECFA